MAALNGLAPILLFFGGFIVAQVAQRIVVPLIVLAIGEKRFAEVSAFDGCTLGIAGAFICPFLATLLERAKFSPWWALLLILVGITLYGLIWLWFLGSGAHKREWVVENGEVKRQSDGVLLHPLCLRQREDYMQTDAYNGYSHYFLDLYDATGKLATNAYTSEKAAEDAIAELRAMQPLIRTLDLCLVWRAEPLKWRVVSFHDVWTPLLGGALARLSEADRKWWHQWLSPQFGGGETPIEKQEWFEHLKRLRSAYDDYPPPLHDGDWHAESDVRIFGQTFLEIDGFLSVTDESILAMSDTVYRQSAREAVGPGFITFCHESDGFVRLEVTR